MFNIQLTKSVKFLFYTNLIVFALTAIFLTIFHLNLVDPLALWSYKSDLFMPHQLITYQFLHGGLFHLIFNMLALISILPSVEYFLNSQKFLIYYLIIGAFAGLFNTFITGSMIPMVGASGSIWGMVVMFALIYPNTKLHFMLIPYGVKAKWLIGAMVLVELFLGLNSTSDGIGHFAHLGGGLMGVIFFLYEKYIAGNF